MNSLNIAHGTLVAEFTNSDGTGKAYEKTVEDRNDALRQFENMVSSGFPDPKNPKTVRDIAEIFEK